MITWVYFLQLTTSEPGYSSFGQVITFLPVCFSDSRIGGRLNESHSAPDRQNCRY